MSAYSMAYQTGPQQTHSQQSQSQGMNYQYMEKPKPPSITKSDFITWFQGESPATRIEIGCALLECLVPIELRFLGTFAEELLSKDYTEIRPAIREANHINGASKSMDEKKMTVFSSLLSDASPAILKALGSAISSQSSSTSYSGSGTNSSTSNSAQSTSDNSSSSNNNPITTLGNQTTGSTTVSTTNTTSTTSALAKPGISTVSSAGAGMGTRRTYNPPGGPTNSLSGTNSDSMSSLVNGSVPINPHVRNPTPPCSLLDSPSVDSLIFSNEKARQRLILYICFMSVHNREVSRVYYSILSQTDQTIGSQTWIDKQSTATLEDLDVLYTVACCHPAFPFEQRIMLKGVLTKIRGAITTKEIQSRMKDTTDRAPPLPSPVVTKQSQSVQVSQPSLYQQQQTHTYYSAQAMQQQSYDTRGYYYQTQYMSAPHPGTSQVPGQNPAGPSVYYGYAQPTSYVYPQPGVPATASQVTQSAAALVPGAVGSSSTTLMTNINNVVSRAEDPELYDIAYHQGPPCDKSGLRRVPCCNCGSQEHSVRECEAPTLEQLTHSKERHNLQ